MGAMIQSADAHSTRATTGRTDATLLDLVRRDPVDIGAFDELIDRYWRRLFARCQLLTQDAELAADLAQETWCRVLRARHDLKPDGNFPGYLRTIATNLWRDWNRASRRRRGMSPADGPSIDSTIQLGDGDSGEFVDMLADPHTLNAEEQAQLAIDVDRALAALSPRVREVIVARFIDGESAAQIGKRHGRTEQTITTWLRQGKAELCVPLGAWAVPNA